MKKVLVVDDSAFMRKILSDFIGSQPDFIVIDTARNGKEAIEKTEKYRPDLITLDVEMPIMNGLTALKEIMEKFPTPVIMVSSLTKEGAESTIKALSLGAIDFIAKTGGAISTINSIEQEIIEKCRMAVKVNVKDYVNKMVIENAIMPTNHLKLNNFAMTSTNKIDHTIVAIGTSTGGPRALQEILTKLSNNLHYSVIIVQHMPAGFTKSLADRLNTLAQLNVKEAENDEVILPGTVYIAPGDYHLQIEKVKEKLIIKLNQNAPISGHRPSVNPMMDSVAKHCGENCVGVLLTGMGSDGAKGMETIKQANGFTIAEDKSTSVVFGMPKAAIELQVVDKIAPLYDIAMEIVKAIKLKNS